MKKTRLAKKEATLTPVEEYFGLLKMPFARGPNIEDLLLMQGQEEMLARLQLATREQSIALVTGRGGCGKSTALRLFAHRLDPNRFTVLYIPNSADGLTGIYRGFLQRLGHVPSFFKPHLVSQVRQALKELVSRGRHVVILCDEANRMTDSWLGDLRMLLSEDMDAASLATLILVGDVSLSSRLRMVSHEALWSRINYRYQLKPLDLLGTAEYIHHHVKAAGYKGGTLFSDGFVAKAHQYTNGLLRRINQLCTYALIAAAAHGTRLIDEAVFEHAKCDLDDDLTDEHVS